MFNMRRYAQMHQRINHQLIHGGGTREKAETLAPGKPPVTKIDGNPVVELKRTEKAVLVESDGRHVWFPMKALEFVGTDQGEYLIAKWFRK